MLGGSTARRERYLEPPADAFWEAVIELGPMPANALYAILATRKAADGTRDATNAVIAAADGNPMKLLVAAQSGADGPRPITPDDDVGISEAEARLIHYLQAHGSSSASDKRLLMELGWSRGRAQQVLKALEDAGLVTAQPAPSDGGPGRPRKVYQLVAPSG